ncbi:MAG TPA: ParB/RepB/Spo0J family partition protein [Candidatus Limnocylindrales bacterium]|nr:ParB/RepB/Spo0J family partition protein [Candidatus Limnocylindrales bacterium]
MTAEPRSSNVGLGRGLAALIPQREEQRTTVELPIAAISRNPYQPRQAVDQAQLEALAASIAEHGVLQPVLVTQSAGGYRLIAGERRLRAAEMAGLERIPALVRSADEAVQLAWALIENLQRSDLNALEEAHAFRQLIDEFGLSHEEVGQRVGRSRSTVANTLRLLDLDQSVQVALQEGRISEGHARALAGLDDAAQQAQGVAQVIARGLSVRQTEEMVRRMRTQDGRANAAKPAPSADAERLERGLREALATKVTLSSARKGGRITIEYYDDEDLARLYERLTGAPA